MFFTYYLKIKKYPFFSNFYRSKYKCDNIDFSTSEHGFMYEKAMLFKDFTVASNILKVTTPRQAKDLGRKVGSSKESEDLWIKFREDIMFKHCYVKFSTIKKLRKAILKTGDAILVEASPRDTIWGIGYNVKNAPKSDKATWGLNLLGKTLMRVREKLIEDGFTI